MSVIANVHVETVQGLFFNHPVPINLAYTDILFTILFQVTL